MVRCYIYQDNFKILVALAEKIMLQLINIELRPPISEEDQEKIINLCRTNNSKELLNFIEELLYEDYEIINIKFEINDQFQRSLKITYDGLIEIESDEIANFIDALNDITAVKLLLGFVVPEQLRGEEYE